VLLGGIATRCCGETLSVEAGDSASRARRYGVSMSNEIVAQIHGRPRDLGGIHVARVLPAIQRKCVGPFVFLDHMGPEDKADIEVRPHPHINLATVTYLFSGAIHHRDNLGSHQVIEPGAINWMTAGCGIAHSERSQRPMSIHGLQLWVGLPTAHEESPPSFIHYPSGVMPAFSENGAHVRVLVGTSYGATSPVTTFSPMVYVDVRLEAGARIAVPTGYEERAAYVVGGAVQISGTRLESHNMAVFVPGSSPVIEADGPARLVFLGGAPLDGPRYIWWNFVSSSKDRITEALRDWREGKFSKVPGDEIEFIPAPEEEPHLA
jgi:redox-sensitive bicupin YhaK (pirin superfamily)